MTRIIHAAFALVISAAFLAAVTGTRAQAQSEESGAQAPSEEQIDRTPEDCVLLNRVARNVAANNHQVVFFMKGNTYYRNDLDAACQALSAGDSRLVFHYRTRSAKITRLCDYDAFTVERQTSRIGCGLGQFHPITAEEAGALTGRPVATSSASSSGSDERSDQSARSSRRDRD